jgi:hypothetical protein
MRLGSTALLAVALLATAGSITAPAAEAVAPVISLIVPAEIAVDGTRTSLTVKARLTNPGMTPMHLQMSTPCDVHDWQLDTIGGERIWERGPMICVQMITEQTVKPGETLEETRMLRIPAPLRPGETYKITYEFWGYSANGTFTAR